MANVITNDNINTLVRQYVENRNSLPAWLRGIPIGDWDVSRVTIMNGVFLSLNNFNEPLNNWNVSNVTDMQHMFNNCNNFNQPLDNWNVSNVTNMYCMFSRSHNFNQPLGNWNVSNVTNMQAMFAQCTIFNQPLENWNVSNVTDMQSMFVRCTNFNQPLENWNVSSVTNMRSLFYMCINFNQPLGNWNVSRVIDMQNMFAGCRNFNQDLRNWNVSRVRHIGHMFESCTSLTINPNWLLRWDIQDFHTMFLGTPLQGTLLQRAAAPAAQPRAPRPAARPAAQPTAAQRAAQQEVRRQVREHWAPPPPPPPPRQLPRGLAYEIHNAFPELNFNKFMDIVRRDNNGASNFKDTRYPLQPLITYINTDTTTTLDDTEKTDTISDLNGEIRTRLNMYLSEHPETKDNVMEMTQFIMSQGPNYKDPYIRFLTYDCINAYGPRNRADDPQGTTTASCTKGIFERVFLTNKSVIIPLCSDDTSSSASSTASSSSSSCKPVYRELLGCFYPDMDLNALFSEWYAINNLEEGSISPLANASEEERKEDFRRFVLHKVPRADPTEINNYIQRNENTFKTLLIGGRRKRKNRKTKRKSLNKGKRKSLRKDKRKTKRRY